MAQTKVSLIKDNVIVVGHLHTNHGITTDHIGEGSNKYYSDTLVQNFLTTNNYVTSTDVATSLSTGAYFTSVSHDTVGRSLTFTKSDGATDSVDLTQYIDDTNLARLTSGTIDAATGIATFTRDDSTTFTVDFSALLDDTNDYVTSAAFSTSNGVLTLTRFGGTNVTVDLDGKYAESVHTHVWTDITDRPTALSSFTNDLGNYGGFLTSFTETDPVFSASAAAGITSTNISNWNTAYGWGNHATAGYLTSFSESDTLTTVTSRGNTTSGDINVHGNILLTGPVTTTNQGRTIDFTGFDKEGTTDFTDRAYIRHTVNTGGYTGSVLEISSQNDANDGIVFTTHASSPLKHNGNDIITSATIGSYALTSLPSHTHDDRYLVKGGGWNATNMPGSRWGGFSANGGEVTFQQDNPNTSQMSVLVDGNFYAGENNGFWSLYNNNDYNQKSGFYTDTSGRLYLQAASQVRISTDGYSDRMTINYDQIWTPVGNLYLQYSSAGWVYLNNGGGHTQSATSLRAPIFYDSDDTNTYFNSSEIVLRGDAPQIAFRDTNHRSVVLHNNSNRFYVLGAPADSTGYAQINGVWPWYVQLDTNDVYTGSIGYAGNSYRAPIFYDRDNTGYYLDPNGTSQLFRMIINTNGTGVTRQVTIKEEGDAENSMGAYPGAWTSALNIQSNNGTHYLWLSPLTDYIPRIQTNYGQLDFYTGDNTNRALHLSGTSARTSILYDIDDTNFYVDPNSTSNLSVLNVDKLGGFLDSAYTDFYVYGDENTYYPVIISGGAGYGFHEYSISRGYGWTAPWDPIGTGAHKGGLTFNFYWSGDIAWGGNDHHLRVKHFSEQYTTMVAGLALPVTGGVCVWLRGGGGGGAMYRLRAPRGHEHGWTVYDGASQYSGHSSSTTFTAGNGATFALRTDTSSVSGEIYGRYPVRGTNEIAAGSLTATSVDAGTLYGDDIYTTGGWFRNHTNSAGIYWSQSGWHLNPYNSQDFTMRSGSSNESTIRLANNSDTTWGYIHNDASKTIGFLNNSRSWVSYTDTSGNHYSVGSSRAPIFYDSSNTGYYCDPNGTSNFSRIVVNASSDYYSQHYFYSNLGGYSGSITQPGLQAYSTANNSAFMSFHKSGHYAVNMGLDADNVLRIGGWSASSNRWELDMSGNNWVASSFRSPIFYDSNDTGYYVDPSGSSNLLNIDCDFVNINKTSTYGTGLELTFSGSSSTGMLIRNNTGTTTSAINFFYSSAPQGARGSITVSSTSTAYNTSSDYRLKENLVDITDGIERVKLLQPKRFNFIGDDKTVDGFIAHETQTVVPEAVTGEKDAVDHEGNPEYQGIDQGKLVPLLTAALQEAIAKIENLEARIQALENA